MKTFQTLRDAFDSQRVPPPTPPLLSDHDILSAIQSAPPTSPDAPAVGHRNIRRTIAFASAGAAVAAGIAWFAFVDRAEPGITEQEFVAGTSQKTIISVTTDTGNQSPLPSVASTLSDNNATREHDAHPVHFTQIRSAAAESLGLTVTNERITYVEDGFRITISTSGISVRGTHDATATPAPKHITLYRNDTVLASWFSEAHAEVGSLVAVRYTLKNPSQPLFPYADVVLWYQPSVAFLDAVPPEVGQQIRQELRGAKASDPFTQPLHTPNGITSAEIFPNPVRSQTASLRLTVGKRLTTTASIINIQGNTVLNLWNERILTEGTHTEPISLPSELANGMYVIVITDAQSSEQIVQRILIER